MLPDCKGVCVRGRAPVTKHLPSAYKLGGLWGEALNERPFSTFELGELGPTFYPSVPQGSYLENGYDKGPARESLEG